MTETVKSAILRAEILRGEESEITCALELTETSVFIVTENLPTVGESINLRLSFPRALRPLMVSVNVKQVRLATEPGTASGFVAEFNVQRTDSKRRLEDISRRLHTARRWEDASSSQPLSVLLVEDNALIRDTFAYAVGQYFSTRRNRRVSLILAPSVAAALAALEDRGGADLLLVDHFLPDEPGSSLVTKLRGHASFHRIPMIGMSGGTSEARSSMLSAGADLFLQKPIALRDLFGTLELLMDVSAEGAVA